MASSSDDPFGTRRRLQQLSIGEPDYQRQLAAIRDAKRAEWELKRKCESIEKQKYDEISASKERVRETIHNEEVRERLRKKDEEIEIKETLRREREARAKRVYKIASKLRV